MEVNINQSAPSNPGKADAVEAAVEDRRSRLQANKLLSDAKDMWSWIQRTLWVSVPIWWGVLYAANWLMLYSLDQLPSVWVTKGTILGDLVELFLKKLGDHIGVLAVAIASTGKIAAVLNKSSDDTVDAINKATSSAAQFVQDAVDRDVLPKLGDASRKIGEDVGRSIDGVVERIRKAMEAPVHGLPRPSVEPLPKPIGAIAPHVEKPEVDYWDDVSRGWRHAKWFLDGKIGEIADGRRRRRYVGLSRYSYETIIEKLWEDGQLNDKQRIAALEMQSMYFKYRPNIYILPAVDWNIFANNYRSLTGKNTPKSD
jgi:hypothetical protein